MRPNMILRKSMGSSNPFFPEMRKFHRMLGATVVIGTVSFVLGRRFLEYVNGGPVRVVRGCGFEQQQLARCEKDTVFCEPLVEALAKCRAQAAENRIKYTT